MRIRLLAVATLAMLAGWCPAEEDVLRLELEHASVLVREPILARVSLVNQEGADLVFGVAAANATLGFEVEFDRDVWVDPSRAGSPVGIWRVAAGRRLETLLDLGQWYPLAKRGRFYIRAVAQTPSGVQRSRLVMLDVVEGLELTALTRGVAGRPEALRTYSLRYWPRDRREWLFLCVSETPGELIYAPVSLGSVVRVAPPTVTVMPDGRVRVWHQTSPNSTAESELQSDAQGVRFVNQKITTQRPSTPQMPVSRAPKK